MPGLGNRIRGAFAELKHGAASQLMALPQVTAAGHLVGTSLSADQESDYFSGPSEGANIKTMYFNLLYFALIIIQ